MNKLLHRLKGGGVQMKIRIFGFYPTEKEAITVVNNLGLKGVRTKDITIFTIHSSVTALKKYTDANICSSQFEPQKKRTFFKQVKDIWSKHVDLPGNFNYRLAKFGFDDQTIEKCLKKVNEGQVLIIMKDYLKLGHSTISEIIRPDLFNGNDQHAG